MIDIYFSSMHKHLTSSRLKLNINMFNLDDVWAVSMMPKI